MKENGKKIVIVPKKNDPSSNSIDSEPEANTKDEENKSFDKEAINKMDQETFEELYEKSFAEFGQGDIITGKVASVQSDKIFVDVGYKSEGTIDRSEFEQDVQVGDDVQVMVVRMEDEYGNVILSKKKADMVITKDLVNKNAEDGTPMQGKIIKENKGGFVVDLGGGLEAFLPGSQLDLRRVGDTKDYIGQKFIFRITKFEPSRNNIILSRKAYLEEELHKKREEFFGEIQEGDVVKGNIKNVLDYGAFIELGVIDGFVHLKDVSWAHIKNCKSVLKEGNEVEAKVLKVDHEQQKITLGLKQLIEDPWETFSSEKQKGDVVNGEVIKFVPFGAFIKVTDGVEGLLHVNDMSWTKKVTQPKQVLKIGEHIQASILEMDKEKRKLSLGLKQVLPNPWDNIDDIYPKGARVKGNVKSITSFGVFIELDNELTGLLHINDIDWIKKIDDLKKEKRFKKGQEIEVVILETNTKEKTISLGLKQLLDNPWEIFRANHPKGSVVKGKVKKVTENGIFVDLGNELEGFLHASEMIKKREAEVQSIYNEGDDIDCSVLKVDLHKGQISLSKKEYERKMEQIAIDKYTKEETDDKKVTLGDLIDFNQFQQ